MLKNLILFFMVASLSSFAFGQGRETLRPFFECHNRLLEKGTFQPSARYDGTQVENENFIALSPSWFRRPNTPEVRKVYFYVNDTAYALDLPNSMFATGEDRRAAYQIKFRQGGREVVKRLTVTVNPQNRIQLAVGPFPEGIAPQEIDLSNLGGQTEREGQRSVRPFVRDAWPEAQDALVAYSAARLSGGLLNFESRENGGDPRRGEQDGPTSLYDRFVADGATDSTRRTYQRIMQTCAGITGKIDARSPFLGQFTSTYSTMLGLINTHGTRTSSEGRGNSGGSGTGLNRGY